MPLSSSKCVWLYGHTWCSILNACWVIDRLTARSQLSLSQILLSADFLCRSDYFYWTHWLFPGFLLHIEFFSIYLLFVNFSPHTNILDYTLCLKKPDTWDIFKYLQPSWTNINNFWYRESWINMLLFVLTILQYVVKQRTSLGFPLATGLEHHNNLMKLNVSQENCLIIWC